MEVVQRFFEEWEKEFLREAKGELALKELAATLGRTEPSVRNYCKRNGIEFKKGGVESRKSIKWTQEEIDYVWDHAHEMTISEMSKALNKSAPSIGWLARKHGMKFKRPQYYTPIKRTLCQECKWCTGLKLRCPYVVSGLKKAVPGWKVQKVKMADYTTLRVIECPLYEKG